MISKSEFRENRNSGMATLEAAIVLPIILTLIFFLLSAIRLVREDSLLRYALDQTCEEIALLLPAAEVIASPVLAKTNDIPQILVEILPIPGAAHIIRDMVVDLGSSLMFGNLINSRIDYWLSEARTGLGLDLIGHRRKLILDWNSEDNMLNLLVKYRQNTVLGPISKTVHGIIPLWTSGLAKSQIGEGLEETDDGNSDQDDIWSLSNFTRGQIFRDKYGANLPFNFPVIAAWDGMTATAIKSIDLTAPSYNSSSYTTAQLERHLINLANFQGAKLTSKGREYLVPAQISRKQLILVIPNNHPQWLDQSQQDEWYRLAASYSIELQIRKYGSSMRYQDHE
ncbi:MAG: hypothetical protein GX314_00530 [Clostridiaceae bacterium]|jgi:hypothetical protein|nr:hypothetical protein [Clostridiaceae bacterium]